MQTATMIVYLLTLMGRFLPKTLFWQLVLATFLVQTTLLFTYVTYLVISQRAVAQMRTRQRMLQQLDLLAPVCERLLASGDGASLRETLALSRISPSIDLARLTDLEGRTLATSDPAKDRGLDAHERAVLRGGKGRQVLAIENGQVEAVTPVVRDGRMLALLWLEPNRAIALTTANAVVQIAGTYGAFALLANILPIFLVVRTITRPLRDLQEATRNIAADPASSSGFPLPVATQNEAGALTLSFNLMVRELRVQRSGLLETLALVDSMLENAPIGFAFFDRELRYIRANRVLADIHELSSDAFPERLGTELHPSAFTTRIEEWIERVFATGEAVHDVELSKDTDSDMDLPRSYLMHFYPVRKEDESIRWVGLIAVEITDRLKAEEALRKTEKLAATGRLAASIAHEINNPLEAVTNLLYLLQTHTPLDPKAADYVETAQSELARVSEITQQTLRFYRQSTSRTRANIGELLESVLALYQPRLTRANVTVRRKFVGNPEVFAYSGELRQVFANLVGNALDAMSDGGVLTLSVRRGCGRDAGGAWREGTRVFVSDSGCGMSKLTLRRMFEPFFTTKQATGTGLGLWVSQEIISKHEGSVRVRSRQGERSGTTFMLFFPDSAL